MKHMKKLLAMVLALCTVLSLCTTFAGAISIADGSQTATIGLAEVHNYLETTAGTRLRGRAFEYSTNDGLTGPAYCIDHGLAWTGDPLPITGKYDVPATAGAFANGYPQHSVATFLELNLAENPILEGLTEDEYGYATQVAVWATLGQLAVDGTKFTEGRERLAQPVGDAQQLRVFRTVQLILSAASWWGDMGHIYETGMYIRRSENELDGNLAISPTMTLDYAAKTNQYGIKQEVINDRAYYTLEYIAASATSTYYQDYTIDLWATNAPEGTMFTDLNNVELPRSRWREIDAWRTPVTARATSINSNDMEFYGKVKLCIPVDTATPSGEITIHSAALIMQYEIFLAENPNDSQQSYIIADPSKGTQEADAVLSWGGITTETGIVQVLKVGGAGTPLEGAKFRLTGTDGSERTGITNNQGKITWELLDPAYTYTLTELEAPAGYSVVEPRSVNVTAGLPTYVTVQDEPLHSLTVRKSDKQNGYSLQGVTICFEQVDGAYKTTAVTDHAGLIQFNADKLPLGTYKIYEVETKPGYVLDTTPQVVNWDGKQDVTLSFENVRKPTLIIAKKDSYTNFNLPEATFEVYKNGQLAATVTTDDNGLAYATDLTPGYYEVKETVAPAGYTLNPKTYSINIDPYDPATTVDPRLVIENDPMPSLRIVKYDRQSMKPLADTVFKVYKDTTLIGSYTTDRNGQILVTGLEPGTYTVQEEAAPGTHIVDTTPQQVELTAGRKEPVALTFFNDKRPGMRIVKVDTADPGKTIQGAVFEIKAVNGSFGPKEITTDENGEIDLSSLPTGAYVVTEKSCPGYVVDNAQRIIELKANENAEFVFTNSKLPTITLRKQDTEGKSMEGVTFSLTKMGSGAHADERSTDAQGVITWEGLEPGLYSLVEVATKATHVLDATEHHVQLYPGKDAELLLTNEEKPSLRIVKYDRQSGQPMSDVVFEVFRDTTSLGEYHTDDKGEILLSHVDPGTYTAVESATLPNYILDPTEHHVELKVGQTASIELQNDRRPNLTIHKSDADTDDPVPGTTFKVKTPDGHSIAEVTTDLEGKVTVPNLLPGIYEVSEKSVPAPYLQDAPAQTVTLYANMDRDVYFQNHKKPGLTINKLDSITGDPIQGVKFSVTYASNSTATGEINDLGAYTTDAKGQIYLDQLKDGWYKVTELAPKSGYAIKDSATQECYIKSGASKVLTFENTPLSALVVYKYDSVTGLAVEGATFQVKYLAGTSGTGGTVIGTYKTSVNGSFTVTGLKAGTYVVEELASDEDHVIDTAPQTALISGKEQDVVQLYFGNAPKASLTVKKVDAVTHAPLSDVEFMVTTADGSVVGDANGKFTTDSSGSFTIGGLNPGASLVVKETRAKTGYLLDDAPQTITVKAGQAASLEFRNQPKGALVIVKRDANTKKPLQGAEFKVTTSDGRYVDAQGGTVSSKGLYTTDKEGQIIITGLEPCTVVVTETKAPSGYVLDETPQTVAINANDTQTLYFYDKPTPTGDLKILKMDEESRQPIQGVEFSVSRINGERLGLYRTNSKGTIYLENLEPGWYTVTETKAAEGYKLDTQPRDVQVKHGQTATVEVTNRLTGSALIHKVDSVTGKGIYGVTFLISDAKGNPVGQYTSDQNGYVYVDGELADGKYTIREIQQAEGYLPDTTVKIFYVEYGGCSTITWQNTPVTGQIQLTKTSADYNTINGWPAGTPIPSTEFEVYSRAGVLVDTIRTDKNGVAATKALSLGRYTLVESKAADNYALDRTPIEVEIEFAGQIVRATMTNKSISTGVAITKTGYAEVMPGQTTRYTLKDIANTSSVALGNFYWRDTLPGTVRLERIVTGTYNAQGNYKLVYRTNLSGEDYRTLADSLSTQKNYTLEASPAALRLASNEYVTEVMAVFGTVPAGFRQVEQTKIDCAVMSWAAGGSQIVNQADVGGTYNGAWVQATSRWVTQVYAPAKPLPRTGY